MKKNLSEQISELNFKNNLQKLNSIIESEEDEKSLQNYKENRPVKNSVQFDNIVISNAGYDNKSYINDNDQTTDFKFRNNKNEKKADSK